MALSDRCPKCHRKSLRVMVNLFLNIPVSLYGNLNKKTLRGKTVRIEGAGWPTASFLCDKCNFYVPGNTK